MDEKLQAYDVHIDLESHIHFQVIVPVTTELDKVLEHANKHLELEGVTAEITEKHCQKLGHTQGPQGDQAKQITDVGYAIFKVHPLK